MKKSLFSGRWTVQMSGGLSSPANFLPAAGPVSNRPTADARHLLQ